MQLDRAKEIIQALADGVDPYTGEPFPANGPYQRADTVRALYTMLEAAESDTKPKKPTDPTKPHAGGKWTPEEEQRLRDAFTANKPIAEVAAEHGRTPGAITSRLLKLGLIEDNPSHRVGQDNRPPPAYTEPAPPTPQPGPVNPNDCPF
jgi:hypothetical protein